MREFNCNSPHSNSTSIGSTAFSPTTSNLSVRKTEEDLLANLRFVNQNMVTLSTPADFSFAQCLVFLGRSATECMHFVEDANLYKLIQVGEKKFVLRISTDIRNTTTSNREDIDLSHEYDQLDISPNLNSLCIEVLNDTPLANEWTIIAQYVWEWFDLDRDLSPFYEMAEGDPVLRVIVQRYRGLRLIAMPDLFEAMTWAMIGQQINLAFAYTLKRRFVENFGEEYNFDERTYWLYPTPERIASLAPTDLTQLQFTGRKSEYIIELAQQFVVGAISKVKLAVAGDLEAQQNLLLPLRGVGKWTANYVIMKGLRHPAAFPIEDVGLHNAIKHQLQRSEKPGIEEIRQLAANWQGWEAYATFYLWRSLYS